MWRFSPRNKGFKSHIRIPSPRVLHWEDMSPEHLALKASSVCIWESQRVIETETLFLQDMRKMSQVLRPRTEAVISKEPESDQLTDLREPPRKAGGNLGIKCWWQPLVGAHSTTRTVVLANTVLESSILPNSVRLTCFQQVGTSTRPLRPHSQLPLILTPPTRGSVLALGSLRPRLTSSHTGTWTCPPAGWQAPHEVGTGSQLGQGPALRTSVPTVVNPATTEGPHSPQRDHPTAYSSDHQSEMCSWAP